MFETPKHGETCEVRIWFAWNDKSELVVALESVLVDPTKAGTRTEGTVVQTSTSCQEFVCTSQGQHHIKHGKHL